MPTQIENEIDAIETRMAELAGEIKKEEDSFKQRLVKGKAVIEKIADTPARLQAQAFFNYLSGWTSKLEASRKILDQTGVLIKQDDGFLVVDQMDDQVRHLIKRAEELGGIVTEVQKVPKQELLL